MFVAPIRQLFKTQSLSFFFFYRKLNGGNSKYELILLLLILRYRSHDFLSSTENIRCKQHCLLSVQHLSLILLLLVVSLCFVSTTKFNWCLKSVYCRTGTGWSDTATQSSVFCFALYLVHANIFIVDPLTFLQHKSTGMVKEEIPKVVAVRINARLLAKACRSEEGECLQRTQCCLAFCHRYRAAGHWKETKRQERRVKYYKSESPSLPICIILLSSH